MAKISIIMPARNAVDTITESIASIQEQHETDWELIVIDDGSEDTTAETVAALASDDIRIRLISGAGKGVSASRNLGLETVQGQYVCFLDADDLMDKESLSARAEMLDTRENINIVYCRTELVDDELNPLNVSPGTQPRLDFTDFNANRLHISGVMIRASVLTTHHFEEELSNGEDWLFMARLARCGHVFYRSDAGCTFYRIHRNSTVAKDYLRHQRGLMHVLDLIFGPDPGCPCSVAKYSQGLTNPYKKAEAISTCRLNAFFWLLLANEVDYAASLVRELTASGRIGGPTRIGNILRYVLPRYYASPRGEWHRLLRKNAQHLKYHLNTAAFSGTGKLRLWVSILSSPVGSLFLTCLPVANKFLLTIRNTPRRTMRIVSHLLRRFRPAPVVRRLTFFPPAADQAELDDRYYRALWYLHPLAKQLKEIVVTTRGNIVPGDTIPPLLDPAIANLKGDFAGKFRFISDEDKAAIKFELHSADTILLNAPANDYTVISALPPGKPFHVIDHNSYKGADSNYLRLSADGTGNNKADLADCRIRFNQLAKRMRASIGYVLGTGPGLSRLADHDFSDGLVIACNTMVKNKALMERVKPRLIVMGDPIFHAGCSVFAGELRKHIIEVMINYDADLIVPWRDYRVYRANMPSSLYSRIIGIPFEAGEIPSFDLSSRFAVTTTSNILTLYLLPLAAHFFDTIRIGGCDGRPLKQNDYFWNHDPASQLTNHMDNIQKAHPAFFQISYDDYYKQHCDTLMSWLDALEEKGHVIQNLTPSHIPALQKRDTVDASMLRNELPDFIELAT